MFGEPDFSLREREDANMEWNKLGKNPMLLDLSI